MFVVCVRLGQSAYHRLAFYRSSRSRPTHIGIPSPAGLYSVTKCPMCVDRARRTLTPLHTRDPSLGESQHVLLNPRNDQTRARTFKTKGLVSAKKLPGPVSLRRQDQTFEIDDFALAATTPIPLSLSLLGWYGYAVEHCGFRRGLKGNSPNLAHRYYAIEAPVSICLITKTSAILYMSTDPNSSSRQHLWRITRRTRLGRDVRGRRHL